MNTTLKNGDWMILNRTAYMFEKVKRFDIIVIYKDGNEIIKRVIGLPNESIEVIDNVLYIDGEKREQNFLDKNINTADLLVEKIPENKYFVLGDNRENSTDSRVIGLIDISEIKGRASFTIFPFNRWGTKR